MSEQPRPTTMSSTSEQKPVATPDSLGIIRFGRDPDNDIVLPDLWVSRKHAEIRLRNGEYELVDVGSSNGIHYNGRRVNRATLKPNDIFTIGRHEFQFDGTNIFQHDDMGPTSIVANDLTVTIDGSQLLDDVSFALRQSTLLGIIGPSGCGKSTLLKAMTGIQPATQGTLLYDDKDLYKHYSQLRYRIGMVPQDDVMHPQLTVRRALRFAASLRFASDVSRRQRAIRVSEVADLLGLTPRLRQRIDKLSGGQRKRTSVALELLTEPSLLALDEPTSGLDPALDKEVMRELRLLADRGRTVVVVTHSVLHLDLCDYVLVMCLGGRMGYFGPPDEVLGFFGAEDYADVFNKVTNDAERWAQRYRNSEVYRRYVGEVQLQLLSQNAGPPPSPDAMPTPRAVPTPRAAPAPMVPVSPAPAGASALAPIQLAPAMTGLVATGPVAASATAPVSAAPAAPSGSDIFADAAAQASPSNFQSASIGQTARHPLVPIRQFFTLCRRMIAVIFADRGYSLFLIGLPLALAVLSHTVPGSKGLSPDPGGYSLEAQRLLVVFVIGAAFMGVAVAIREIINEATIYKRERAIGLSATAYLASKVVIFVIIDCIQVALFVYLALLGRGGPKEALVLPYPVLEIMVAVALVAIASTALGLLASTLVNTAAQTTPILVVSVMTQLVLSGGLFQIHGQTTLEVISWLDPSRWGFAAAAATTNLLNFPLSDPLWDHDKGNWIRSAIVLGIQIVALLVATRIALRRYEPGRG